MIRKVISGGQTGVDRAGLEAALQAGIPIGGYCDKGRTAEDGTIPTQYPMIKLESSESYYRTEKNVIESDGTLILNIGELTQGSKLTHDFTIQYGKPSPSMWFVGSMLSTSPASTSLAHVSQRCPAASTTMLLSILTKYLPT
jgi:hypothetical protein